MKKLTIWHLAALIAASAFGPMSFAAMNEDDWFRVEYPDKVTPNEGYQVKVTLKKDLGPEENVSVHMHQFNKGGGWMNAGEWRPPQDMRKGETRTYQFTAKGDPETFGHYAPFVFSAPKGDFNKATHKFWFGKIAWSITAEEAARRAAEAKAREERMRPPAGITYKKSWIRPIGIFRPGTDEKMDIVHEGEKFEVRAEYYLDASEYWNDKCNILFMPCGPWIDNPDGKYEARSRHVNVPGTWWDFRPVKPGHGIVKSVQGFSQAYRYNSLFFHVRFRGGDDKDFPWTTTVSVNGLVRGVHGFDIVAPTAGGLFVKGRDKPVFDLVAGKDAAEGATVKVEVYGIDGERDRLLSAKEYKLPAPGTRKSVPIEGVDGYSGVMLIHGTMEQGGSTIAVDAFAGIIQDVAKALSGKRPPFGGTDIRTEEEAAAAEKLGLGYSRMFIGWGGLVPRRGVYNFAGVDKTMEVLARHRIKPWLMLTGTPEWVLPPDKHSPGFCPFPFDAEGWDEASREIARHFAPKVHCIEWLNEIVPGSMTEDPVGDYKRFVEIGARNLRAAGAGAKSSMAGGLWPRNYRLDLLNAGIGKHVDILPIHYGSYSGAKEAIADAAMGGVGEVWDNESAAGISCWGMPGREALTSSLMQSRYVMRNWPAELAAGIKGIIYFGGEANPCGNWKYMLDNHTPRPVAATLAVLSAKLGDARPIGGVYLEPGAVAYIFEKPDGSGLAVVGSANASPDAQPVAATIPCGKPPKALTATDHQGNTRNMPGAVNGAVAVSAAAMPEIYEGLQLAPVAILASLSIEGQDPMTPKPSVRFVKDTEPRIHVSVLNPLEKEISAAVSIEIDGVRIPAKKVKVAPGGAKYMAFDVPSVPAMSTRGRATVAWEAPFAARATRDFAVEVVDPDLLGNLLANGDFELNGGSKEHWSGNGEVVEIPEGGHALKFAHSKGYAQALQTIKLPAPGRDYLYTAWVKTEKMADAGSNITTYKGDSVKRNMYIPQVFSAPSTTKGWALMAKRLSTDPDETKAYFQPVARGENGVALYDNLRVTLYEGTEYAAEAQESKAKKKIDGQLDDWDLSAPIPLLCDNQVSGTGGYEWSPANFAGRAFFAWDKEALYIALVVKDSKHVAETGADAISGDALQIGLHPANRIPGTDAQAIEWYISSASPGSGSGKHTIFRPAAHSAGLKSGQLAKDSSVYEIAVRTVGDETTYEVRMPWSEIGGFRPQMGAKLGLSMRLHDSDGGAAHGVMTWGAGLDPWAPTAFGVLTLTK